MTTDPVSFDVGKQIDQVNAWLQNVQTTLQQATSGSTDAASAFADVLSALQSTPSEVAASSDVAADTTPVSDSPEALAASTLGLTTADSSDSLDGSSVGAMSLSSLAGSSSTGSYIPPSGVGATGSDVVTDAMQYLGTPYLWGGNDPSEGLDCSAFVQHVMGDLGYTVPRVAHLQQQVGVDVGGLANAQPGDLVFFGKPASHVGIYVGNGYMIDAPHTGTVVRTESIKDFGESVSSVRRVVGVSPQLSYASLNSTLNSTNVSSLASFLGTSPLSSSTAGASLNGLVTQ